MKKYLLLLPLAAGLAGCSTTPPPVFQPLDYSYLPPIALKVANLNIVNNYVPSPDQTALIGEDPAPPEATLLAALQHRLVASGEPGTGTVTIQMASLSEANSIISGTLTVDINVASADGRSTGFTEASVTASQPAADSGSSPGDTQTVLYNLTKQLMDTMNVQIQYQIQHSIPNWVSYTSVPGAVGGGQAPVFNAIQAAPLSAPAAAAQGLVPPQSLPGAAP